MDGRCELIFFRGNANAVDHISVNSADTTLTPVFPQETAIGIALEFPVFNAFTARAGIMHHWQIKADSFAPYVLELEHIWEWDDGSNLFAEIGYADVIGTKDTGLSNPELDMRRIYKGGTILTALEYEPTKGTLLGITGTYNIKYEAFYFSPKISREIELGPLIWEFELKGEFINSQSSQPNFLALYEDKDRVLFTLEVKF